MRSLLLLCVLAAAAPAADPKPRYETRKDHDPDGIGKFYLNREIAHVVGENCVSVMVRVGTPEDNGAVAAVPFVIRPLSGLENGFAPLVKLCAVHTFGPTTVPLLAASFTP